MVIKILGTGCSRCKALFATVENVVNELGVNVKIVKEEELQKIMNYNVMSLPALVIDEQVVAKGKISADEVKKLITERL